MPTRKCPWSGLPRVISPVCHPQFTRDHRQPEMDSSFDPAPYRCYVAPYGVVGVACNLLSVYMLCMVFVSGRSPCCLDGWSTPRGRCCSSVSKLLVSSSSTGKERCKGNASHTLMVLLIWNMYSSTFRTSSLDLCLFLPPYCKDSLPVLRPNQPPRPSACMDFLSGQFNRGSLLQHPPHPHHHR